jgi:hypothetical protein
MTPTTSGTAEGISHGDALRQRISYENPCSASMISLVEAGRRPDLHFARHCDEALRAGVR